MSDNDDLCRHAIVVTDVTRAVSGLDHAAAERSLRFSLIAGGQKRGLLIGMGMTEKQGGSDVMSNTTRAERLDDGSYRLVGHKWFSRCRKAMRIWCWHRPRAVCPAFCAALLPDGQRNAIRLERLKDKLGNRSNASCEVEFQDAIGWLLGQEGEGIRLILKMGGMTRFDCAPVAMP